MDQNELEPPGENDGLWDWNLKSKRMHFSLRWISMLGCEQHEVGNTPEEWFRRIHPEDQKQVQLEIDAVLAGNAPRFESQHRMLHKDGTYRWMSCHGIIMRNKDGRAVRMTGSHSDITAEKVTDALTGLPNRLLLLDRLSRSLERARRHNDFTFAVLILDIDRFKSLVERLGSSAGDQLLIAAARRLETCLRAGDTVARLGFEHVLARLGGDEFIILLDGLNEVGDAKFVAERLLKEISAPFEIIGHEVYISASIGIALSITGYSQPEEALRDADIALHRAKSLGKARCEAFDTASLASAQARLQLEADIKGALERQEFVVFYQPVVSLASNRIAGFEALVRWNHPTRGMVGPLEFIPVAERTGLIIPLGRWVLREACRQLKSWQDVLGIPEQIWISVNFSNIQFKQPALVKQIREVLDELKLDPHCLILELTESAVTGNPESASSLLMQLRVMGTKVALDDFGTGYSSLSYLRQFPVDFVKIDHSFVRRMETDKDLAEIVRAIGDLAHQLGLHVIAEGIENSEQLDLIRSLQCEYGQGYLLSKPVDSEKAEALLMADLLPCQGTPEQQPSTPVAADQLPEEPVAGQKKKRMGQGTKRLLIASAASILLLSAGAVVRLNRITPRPPASKTASGENLPSPVKTSRQPSSGKPDIMESAPAAPRNSVPAETETARAASLRPAGDSVSKSKPHLTITKNAAAPSKPLTYSVPVLHDHVLGSCKGILEISRRGLSFVSEKEKEGFTFQYEDFSYASSDDRLTIKSGSKTYRFKPATAGGKDQIRSQIQKIVGIISGIHPVGPRQQ